MTSSISSNREPYIKVIETYKDECPSSDFTLGFVWNGFYRLREGLYHEGSIHEGKKWFVYKTGDYKYTTLEINEGNAHAIKMVKEAPNAKEVRFKLILLSGPESKPTPKLIDVMEI